MIGTGKHALIFQFWYFFSVRFSIVHLYMFLLFYFRFLRRNQSILLIVQSRLSSSLKSFKISQNCRPCLAWCKTLQSINQSINRPTDRPTVRSTLLLFLTYFPDVLFIEINGMIQVVYQTTERNLRFSFFMCNFKTVTCVINLM